MNNKILKKFTSIKSALLHISIIAIVAFTFTNQVLALNYYKETTKKNSEIIIDKKIQIAKKIVDSYSPTSFCVTPDDLFLIPDSTKKGIFIFELENINKKKGKSILKELVFLDNDRLGQDLFVLPMYLQYSVIKGQEYLTVVDFGTRRIYIFKRLGKINFTLHKSLECPRLCYDLALTENGEEIVIAGSNTDESDNSYDLYKINLKTNINDTNILPSYKKYNLKSNEEYIQEYKVKQTLPAIGLKAFIDIYKNDLYFVWEGALNITKVNLVNFKISPLKLKYNRTFYKKPDSQKLVESYLKGDFEDTRKIRESMSYIKNIFVTSNRVFLVYETSSIFRIQSYTIEGEFINETVLSENPNGSMWLNRREMKLLFFSKDARTGKFTIFIYNLSRE